MQESMNFEYCVNQCCKAAKFKMAIISAESFRTGHFCRLIFISLMLLVANVFKAQFDGIGSYQSDKMFSDQLKAKGVSCVSELGARETYTYNGGLLCVDRNARPLKLNRQGNYLVWEYDNKGRIIKTTWFDPKDTTVINYWYSYVFDDKDRLLKQEVGNNHEGKLEVRKESETVIVAEKHGVTRTESKKFYGDKVVEISYKQDSVSGIYRYEITYSYEPGNEDEKGRKNGTKTLERYYEKNHCIYSEEIKYKVFGKIETLEEIKGWYTQRDPKGRVTEEGSIDYENAMMEYVEQHPEEFNMYALPPQLAKDLLSGKLKGAKKQSTTYKYNEKGQLAEKEDYTGRYKFVYNQKGLLIEQTCEGYTNSTYKFEYNEKGLIARFYGHFWDKNDEQQLKKPSSCVYSYSYY
jgi:YD repeat-containing protein